MISHNYETLAEEILPDQAKTLTNVDKTFLNEENILLNPTPNFQHILLLYENENELMTSVKTYLNEGLNRGDLCIHATVNLMSENYIRNLASQIEEYQKNREDDNFLMFNLQPYYKKAVTGNLRPFDKLAKLVADKVQKDGIDTLYKEARLTMDCASMLFKNGYFEQCTDLETWLHQKPFTGSHLCIYPRSLFDIFPNDIYFSTLVQCHDVVVDTKGRKVTKYMI